ncbi:hypothetical protein BGX21_006827 [Mortierella sp. AD011]|nr:hypothetical protein BGX20_009291 [Mortierella sp. AD010]KAF9403128.1 hypothetical protein BGX21_006827 [Mortierella sp. AD011]
MSASKNAFLATFKHLTRAGASNSASARVPRITKPIVAAPMNGWTGPKLVAAVANHGGFPVFPIGYFTDRNAIIKEVRSVLPLLKDPELHKDDDDAEFLPYGVGFITFWLDQQGPELLINLLEGKGDDPNRQSRPRPPAAVWFSFGNYKPYLKLIRERRPGTKVLVQVQTVQEALEAQRENVDVIVLQGTESGGHGIQRVSPLMTLVPTAVQALKDEIALEAARGSKLNMPAILAAGGISVASQFAAVQAMGASGAVIGTGFMPTYESSGPQHAKERLLQTGDGGINTVRTRIFDELRGIDWPQPYDGRVVRNLLTNREEEDLRGHGLYQQKGLAAFRLIKEDRTGTKEDWVRAVKEQDFDIVPLWAGTGVGMLTKQASAAEFIDQLIGEQH